MRMGESWWWKRERERERERERVRERKVCLTTFPVKVLFFYIFLKRRDRNCNYLLCGSCVVRFYTKVSEREFE